MGKRYKPKFDRDYEFYLKNKDKFNLAGCVVPSVPFSEGGVDAKRAFWFFDSQGKLKECKDPELFRELVACKKSINMHILMWAEGQMDCLVPIEELMSEFTDPPEWVEESLRNQIMKVYKRLE